MEVLCGASRIYCALQSDYCAELSYFCALHLDLCAELSINCAKLQIFCANHSIPLKLKKTSRQLSAGRTV